MQGLITAVEAAAKCQVALTTVHRWHKRGMLAGKLMGKVLIVSEKDLDRVNELSKLNNEERQRYLRKQIAS